jgi:hypothetical protein
MNEIHRRVADIADMNGDDEAQHSMEDDLRQDFIRYVADLSDNSITSAMARAVLQTSDMDFARWCA